MVIRLDRFFFDEKDIFTVIFSIFSILVAVFNVPIAPFRSDSLIVLALFLLITRSLKSSLSYEGYVIICIFGLFFSMFLSPYGLAVYLIIATLLYLKMGK